MRENSKPMTSKSNGKLWGVHARDWADKQEGAVRPVYQAVLNRIDVGHSTLFLDAGCGAGMAAGMAAEHGADVTGIDASEALLEVARERTPASDFRQSDLEELPFDDDTFDVVTGFNSFQYAGNPVAALAEARRVTEQAGTVVVMTWGEPEGMETVIVVTALKPLLPPPPPGAPGPFALSDETTLKRFAADAGLKAFDIIDVESPWKFPDKATVLTGL
jgi:ubiquinone/menaquinone biosynthesis C-methylase UbiE